jgi:hypothetical protein
MKEKKHKEKLKLGLHLTFKYIESKSKIESI